MQPDRRLPCFAQPIERDARERHEQLVVGGDLATHDPARHRERELNELPLGLLQQRLAQRGQLLERLAQTPQHRIAAAVAGFDAGPFALGVALRERITLERRQVRLLLDGVRWLTLCVEQPAPVWSQAMTPEAACRSTRTTER